MSSTRDPCEQVGEAADLGGGKDGVRKTGGEKGKERRMEIDGGRSIGR